MPPDLPEPKTLQAAVREMADRPFLKSQKWQEQQGRADWRGAHPDLVDFHKAFQSRLGKLGVPMFAHEVMRTTKRQQELFELGMSKAPAGNGPHPYGCAMDLVHSVVAWNLSKAEWKIIGHVGHEVANQGGWKMTWGGDDGPNDRFNWDPAHWEVTPWRNVKDAMDDAEQSLEGALNADEVVNNWRAQLKTLHATINDPASSVDLVKRAVEQRANIKRWLGQ